MAEEFAGYKVRVFSMGQPLDAKGFPFGEWQEIGYWLDDCGYNVSRYQVVIHFIDEKD